MGDRTGCIYFKSESPVRNDGDLCLYIKNSSWIILASSQNISERPFGWNFFGWDFIYNSDHENFYDRIVTLEELPLYINMPHKSLYLIQLISGKLGVKTLIDKACTSCKFYRVKDL